MGLQDGLKKNTGHTW